LTFNRECFAKNRLEADVLAIGGWGLQLKKFIEGENLILNQVGRRDDFAEFTEVITSLGHNVEVVSMWLDKVVVWLVRTRRPGGEKRGRNKSEEAYPPPLKVTPLAIVETI